MKSTTGWFTLCAIVLLTPLPASAQVVMNIRPGDSHDVTIEVVGTQSSDVRIETSSSVLSCSAPCVVRLPPGRAAISFPGSIDVSDRISPDAMAVRLVQNGTTGGRTAGTMLSITGATLFSLGTLMALCGLSAYLAPAFDVTNPSPAPTRYASSSVLLFGAASIGIGSVVLLIPGLVLSSINNSHVVSFAPSREPSVQFSMSLDPTGQPAAGVSVVY